MWSYLLIFLGVTIATGTLLYLDSRLFDKPKTRLTYIKTMVMTNVLTFVTLGILTWLSPSQGITAVMQAGGHVAPKIVNDNTQFIQQIGEEMLGGDAPF